ncbi:nucleoside triphosphate pyrophosphohydrolase [Hyphomicrobium sp. CS1GBMeth3]|uniref:nucleoside triphosphate pyrophosphohydrolase n=1 Tax=Hyphomicrobium sp. CS1GBMeth3 TaxID=1892845 RepID=UPI000930C823|nr:nucleoside triphosphate pyrophosphohydrolase [Hyphomicrobium sp. CS1GBMeth3]
MTPSKDITRLIEIMAALRTPGSGCPWDLEQTYETIAPYTIEEAYEVADAIARGDRVDLKDELGDLLLQVVYHARMAEEEDAFAFGDVVEAVTTKMIRRHPHVFGDEDARAAGAAPGFWARIKAEERTAKAATRGNHDETPQASLLDDVPVGLPALTRAIKLQDKAAAVGFDWPSLAPVFDKMREELSELEEIAVPADPRGNTTDDTPERRAKIEEEMGDLLFVMANVARHLKLDPEEALRAANRKFVRRFRHIEQRLAEEGSTPKDSTLEQMDSLWDEARANERK